MTVIDKSTAKLLQRALKETTGAPIKVDGVLGEQSLKALQKLAGDLSLPEPEDFRGLAFELVLAYIRQRFVTEEAYAQAAKVLGVDEASVRAVAQVESVQAGFLPDGRLTILFERHWFYKKMKEAVRYPVVQEHVAGVLKLSADPALRKPDALLQTLVARENNICNALAGGYLGKEAEWPRLLKAAEYDLEAAYASASYGTFQIMGFNHLACGYKLPSEMVLDFARSESAQFLGVCSFIKANPVMHQALKDKNWAKFAEKYNGSNYAINNYDVKLRDAYAWWVKELKN